MEAAALARNLEKWILCSALPPHRQRRSPR